jgi:energy-coupling factor transporter ATP-binding protein EcfA2
MGNLQKFKEVVQSLESVQLFGSEVVINRLEQEEVANSLALLREYLLEGSQIESVYKQITLDVLSLLDLGLYSLGPVDFILVTGGPGSGKSRLLKQLYTTIRGSTILTPFSELKESVYQGFRCTTLHVACLKGYKSSVLLVDEYTSCDLGLVLLAALRQYADFVVLVGDPLQSWLKDDEGLSFSNTSFSPAVKLLNNYRNPAEDVQLLNDLFSDDMIAKSSVIESGLNIVPLYDQTFNSSGIFLTFASQSCVELEKSGITASTVRSAQGVGSDTVHLFIFDRDVRLVAVPELLRVALSRHRSQLVIHTDNPAIISVITDSRQIPVDFGLFDKISEPTPFVCRDETKDFDYYFPVLGKLMDLFVG